MTLKSRFGGAFFGDDARAIGDQTHDQLAREEMLRLASKYERLADWTEERNRPRSSSAPIAR
jgi:hypothetical protein